MRMDTDVTDYASLAELGVYMHGSAAVIGLQMLPVLGTVGPRAAAEPHAAALGVAFQLTNFLRDVGEDLDRGRVYLPADELAAFGVDRELLRAGAGAGAGRRPRCGGRWPTWSPTRVSVYRRAEPGPRPAGTGRPALRALRVHALPGHPGRDRGRRLRRAAPPGGVPLRRRLAVAGPALLRVRA